MSNVATGAKLNRFFYDAALQLQYPTASGLEPYLFAGGGAVTLHEVGTSGQNKTKGAGTFGLGFNYRIPNSQFGVFAEGKSWVYQLNGLTCISPVVESRVRPDLRLGSSTMG